MSENIKDNNDIVETINLNNQENVVNDTNEKTSKSINYMYMYKDDKTERVSSIDLNARLSDGWLIGFGKDITTSDVKLQQVIINYVYHNMTYVEMDKILKAANYKDNELGARYLLRGPMKDDALIVYNVIIEYLLNHPNDFPETMTNIAKSISYGWYNQSLLEQRANSLLGSYSIGNVQQYRNKLIKYNKKVCEYCGTNLTDDNTSVFVLDNFNTQALTLLSNCVCCCKNCADTLNIGAVNDAIYSKTYIFNSSLNNPTSTNNSNFNHGHTYKLDIIIGKPISPITGSVINDTTLDNAVYRNVIDLLDNELINRFVIVPTLENIIIWIWQQLSIDIRGIGKIKLSQDDRVSAEINRDNMRKYINNNIIANTKVNDDIVLEQYELNHKINEALAEYF